MRWAPAVVIPVAIAAAAIVTPLAAGAADLPVKSPSDVLRLVASSDTRSFSGTVEQSSDLGLPSLPSTSSGSQDASAADVLELALADHTAKVWVDGPTQVRVQVLDKLAERDAIRNGSDVWLYQSAGKKVTHATLPAHEKAAPTPDATALTPSQLAQRFLDAVDPSTTVTLGDSVSVAGRDAYDLVLTPKADADAGRSRLDRGRRQDRPPAEGRRHRARGQRSRVRGRVHAVQRSEAGRLACSRFTPPKGATVTEQTLPTGGHDAQAKGTHPRPTVTGEGWATVVALPAGSAPASVADDPLFAQLTQPVDGGRALSSSLLSVLVTSDGRVLAGAVPVSVLQAAANAAGQ